jgi:hypothetical protein
MRLNRSSRRGIIGRGIIVSAFLTLTAFSIGYVPGMSRAQTPQSVQTPVPEWLRGIWHRDWIERAGKRSNPREVEYLQTPTLFGDVRFPTDLPAFPEAKSFADLTDTDLRLLAGQQGMTGLTRVANAIATWDHAISFQPPDGGTDTGRLDPPVNGLMYEYGLDGSYTEAWQAVPGDDRHYLVIQIQRSGRLDRVLIVAGDRFMYVRNRAKDLPVADSFDKLISSTNATRPQIIEYLDCEFSTGQVPNGRAPWIIQRSTLPWRKAHRLELVDEIHPEDFANGMTRHNAPTQRWTVPVNTLTPKQISTLFRESNTKR